MIALKELKKNRKRGWGGAYNTFTEIICQGNEGKKTTANKPSILVCAIFPCQEQPAEKFRFLLSCFLSPHSGQNVFLSSLFFGKILAKAVEKESLKNIYIYLSIYIQPLTVTGNCSAS